MQVGLGVLDAGQYGYIVGQLGLGDNLLGAKLV